MFNPFKPHIVQLYTGDYAIRKLQGFLWVYIDSKNNTDHNGKYWWYGKVYVIKYCGYPTLEAAEAILVELQIKKPIFSKRVIL